MRAWILDGSFGLEQLTLKARDRAEPGPGQVRLKMTAASLNFRDLLMVRGLYNPRQPLPLIPCSDGVGVVEAVGDGVDEGMLGQRVMPIFAQGWLAGAPTREKLMSTLGGPLDGTLAEEMVVSADGVVEVPEHLTDVEAATLPCAGVTAWNALAEQGGIRAGQTVLTLGTGGVSIFALQFGRLLGARVFITSSKEEKLARARALGAEECINYVENPKWGKVAAELAGDGVDLVVEVGGAGTLEQSVRAVKIGGRISLIGVLSGGVEAFNVIPVLMRNLRIQGVIVGHREMFEAMNRAIEFHGMRPVVDRVYGFEEVPAAFEDLGKGEHFGKLCIDLTQ